MEFKKEVLDKFIETAVERHKIYLRKESGEPKPWTNDEVFQKFFFCNVFRQYDKCSKWIIKNIIPMMNNNKRWDLVILYRFISTMEIYTELEEKKIPLDELESVLSFLGEKRARGEVLFSGCFLRNPRISGNRWAETYKVPWFTVSEIRSYEENSTIPFYERIYSLKDMVSFLSQFSGIKGFMGYEYACDFEYSKWFNPIDKYTWANRGPGANKGMSYLIYGDNKHKIPEEIWLILAQQLFLYLQERFKREFPEEYLSMREVEHWLCEFQKYIKYMQTLAGGPKVKYRLYNGGL